MESSVKSAGEVEEGLIEAEQDSLADEAEDSGMSVITMANTKGGAGKSTLAMVLGSAALSSGEAVAFFDGDPQGSLSHWMSSSQEAGNWPDHAGGGSFASVQEVVDKLNELSKAGFGGLVIIDTAGVGEEAMFRLASISDVVVVPAICSSTAFNTTKRSVELLREFLGQIDEDQRPALKIVRTSVRRDKELTKGLRAIYAELGKFPETVEPHIGHYNLLEEWEDQGPLYERFKRQLEIGGIHKSHGGTTKRVLEEGVKVINALFEDDDEGNAA